MAEKLVFDLLANDKASVGFAAAGRAAAAAADDVQGLQHRLDEISNKSAKARVGLEGSKEAQDQLDKLDVKLLLVGNRRANPNITLQGALKANLELAGISAELDKLGKKAENIGGGSGGAGGSSGGILGLLSGGLTSPAGLTAIGVAIGPLLVEADGLVSGFAAAGAGIGAFGLLALPTFKAIATAYTGISAAHQKYMAALATEKESPTKANAAATAKALIALQVAQENLSPSTKKAVGGIQALDDEYHKMSAAFAPDALKVFNDALGIANTLLPDIKPFADIAAGAIDGLLKKAEVFFKSADFHAWLGTFEKDVGPAITAIGKGLGQVTISAGKLFTIMSSKDMVHAINIAFDTINGVLVVTGDAVRGLMKGWDIAEADVKLHTSQLVHFFVVDVPAGLEIMRDNMRLVWDQVELDVLHMASSVTNTMGKLPGPLGAPFRTAHTAISHDLAGIEANVAQTEAQINADWAKIHGTANIVVHADGTFSVGTTGLKGKAAGGLITGGTPGRDSVLWAGMPGEVVVPVPMVNAGAVDHLRGRLPGFAAGGVVSSYSGAVPGLGPWMGKEAMATQQMLESLTAKATAAAMKTAAATFTAAGAGGSGVTRWAPMILAVLAMLHQSSANLGAVEHRMNQESGGNPNAINLTDSNAAAGDPSRGLMQTIMTTFQKYRSFSLPDNIYDPEANIYAGLNYAVNAYAPRSLSSVMLQPGGYDKGGYLPPGVSVAYNGTGQPEPVTSPVDMKAVHAELRGLRADLAKHPAAIAAGVQRAFDGMARRVVT
jgi:Transglycosylase SLT domain